MSLDIRGTIDIDAGPIKQSARSAAKALKQVADAGESVTIQQRAAAKMVVDANDKMQREYRATGTAARQAGQAASDAMRKFNEADRNGRQNRANSRATTTANVGLTGARTAEVATRTADGSAVAAGTLAYKIAQKTTEEVKQQGIISRTNALNTQGAARVNLMYQKEATAETRRQARDAERAAKANKRATDIDAGQLAGTRYALYDVARTAAIAGAAMLALSIVPAKMAINFERDFASVRRTISSDTPQAVENLKRSFIGLTQSIPVDWGALTEIGTLAGQLGIANENISAFAASTAKFTATTDVSVEMTATAFGRLNSLLPDVKNDFESLGDSILKVGVNSVATESQIVKITTQISSIAGGAGFSSKEVIGLAGALASVGAPPELSRGVITRVFGKMTAAATDGGAALAGYAQLAGMSAEEFKKAWLDGDTAGTFTKFMGGIQKQGSAAQATLRELGITSVRDVPILTRLAGAADSAGKVGGLLTQTMGDAKNATGEMTRQYEIFAGTVSGKVQILQNAFAAFLAAAGEGSLGPLGVIIDLFTDKLIQLEKMMSSELGSTVVGIITLLTALAGVIGLLVAAAAMGVAGIIALVIALTGLSASAGATTITYGGLITMLRLTGPLGVAAARGITAMTVAARFLSGALVALAVPEVLRFTEGIGFKMAGYGNTVAELSELVTRFADTEQSANQFYETVNKPNEGSFVTGIIENEAETRIQRYLRTVDDGSRKANRSWANFGLGAFAGAVRGQGEGTIIAEIKRLDDAMADLVRGGSARSAVESFDQLALSSGKTFEELLKDFPALEEGLKENDISVRTLKDGTLEYSNSLGVVTSDLGEFTDTLSEAEQIQVDFAQTLSDGYNGFIDFADAIKMATDEEAGFSFGNFIGELDKQIVAQDSWATNMQAISGRVSDGLLGELAKLGVEGAPLVAAMVTATEAELATMEKAFNASGVDSGAAFAAGVVSATAALKGIAALAGQETADQLAIGMGKGTVKFEEVLKIYDGLVAAQELKAEVDASVNPVSATLTDAELQALADKERRADILSEVEANAEERTLRKLLKLSDNRTSPFSPTLSEGERQEVIRRLNEIARTRTAMINVQEQRVGPRVSGSNINQRAVANGGLLSFYANGGENHNAQIASPNGTVRIWAEPETEGEAYIPFARSKRSRSISIWEQTGKRLGVEGFASGGMSTGGGSPYQGSFGSRQSRGSSNKGMTVVELSARSIEEMNRTGATVVQIGNKVVAEATTAGNLVSNRRGRA